MTIKFEEAINRLNRNQLLAVSSVEGPVMVIAGPGTGKTQILILRIANILLKTQINPENILALTFTESGVYAMKERLVEIIGTPGYRVEINTFHGFCNELIKNNPDDFPNLASFDNAGELEQVQIVEKIIDEKNFTFLKPLGNQKYYVKLALKAIEDLKKEGITPEMFAYALGEEEKEFNKADLYHEKGKYKGKMKTPYERKLKNINKNKELLIIYRDYQKILQEKKLYDFNDMLLEVIAALEKNEQLLLRLQEQYQYILIDEHQDTNTAQNKVIELLCNFYKNPNLFVVGDEKQSIYRFQGASLENFFYFKKLYPGALLINLKENYRSSQMILDASCVLIQNNSLTNKFLPESAKLVAKIKHRETPIKIIVAKDYYSEYFWIASSIKEKISSGVFASEIAVLARENKDLFPLIEALEYNSIPYFLDSNLNLLQDAEIKKLILLFKAIYNFGNDEDLIFAMYIDYIGIDSIDIARLLALAHNNKTSVWEVIRNKNYKNDKNFKTADNIEHFFSNLSNWKKLSFNERFDILFKKVINESGLMKNLISKKNSLQNLDKITLFYENIKDRITRKPDFNLSDFIKYLELLRQHNLSIKGNTKNTYKNAVRLMTAHKSKGLEFDVVYILNSYDGHWGNSYLANRGFSLPWDFLVKKVIQLSEEEKNEDQRRLFYVAVTRARKEVLITYSIFAIDGKNQIASQFIEEISESFKKNLSIEKFEKDFLDNKQIILSELSVKTGNTKDEYLNNKEFFAEIFAKKGFAATHLNNYLKCPWRYFFRNLLNLPETMNERAMFGSAIHQALNEYLIHKNKKPSLDFLINSYKKALQKQPLREKEMKRLDKEGEKVLKNFYNKRILHWKNNLTSELNIKGVQLDEKIKLTGRIDMIEEDKNDKEKVTVYDFKTGKPKSRNQIEGLTGEGDYKRQLLFYKILLDRYKYKKMKMSKGVIEFVEPNERGILKQEVFEIKAGEVKDLEEQIKKIAQEVLSFEFWNKGCKKADCEYCFLRSCIID